MAPGNRPIAVVHGAPLGLGGLGVQSANAVAGAARAGRPVEAYGPAGASGSAIAAVRCTVVTEPIAAWRRRYTSLRWWTGRLQVLRDRRLGAWAAERVAASRPALCYAFTQVALETLRWCRRSGVPSVLDSPNGHIRGFGEVYRREAERWCGGWWPGHPTAEMVERVEEEYALADRIRASSRWSRDSLVAGGVPAAKIEVLEQGVDLARYRPPAARTPAAGPLRVVFVGSLDLRKGFVYLLAAVGRLGAGRVALTLVGATGDRCCRRLLAARRAGLDVRAAPGDPVPELHRAEVLAHPSLEDGSPFAVAEAMACGLPALVASTCGAAEWVRQGESGWVVPPREPDAIAAALEEALRLRQRLATMGERARRDTERRAEPGACAARLGELLSALAR